MCRSATPEGSRSCAKACPSGTELSSPSMRHWSPRSRARASRSPLADAQPGVALARAAQRKRRHTYPELLRARRCRLVVFGIETGGRGVRKLRPSPGFSRRPALPAHLSPCAALLRPLGCTVGVASSPLPRSEPSWLRCSSFLQPQSSVLFFFFSAHFLRQVKARSQCNCKLQYPARARPKSELAGGWKPVHPAITRLARPRAQPARRQQRRLCQEGARATR